MNTSEVVPRTRMAPASSQKSVLVPLKSQLTCGSGMNSSSGLHTIRIRNYGSLILSLDEINHIVDS
jgi:archaellum component FlaF (FlaF/FlaG flagellin family)